MQKIIAQPSPLPAAQSDIIISADGMPEPSVSSLEPQDGEPSVEEGEGPIVEAELDEEEAAQLEVVQGAADIWHQYQSNPTAQTSAKLVDRYLPFVRYLASRTSSHLPNSVDEDDLIQDGTIGLLDAIDAYDPGLGVKFETFAARRIKGAMLDGIREMDWVARLDRKRSSVYNGARERLAKQDGRAPTEEEIATELKMSAKDFEIHRLASRSAHNHRHAGDFRPRGKGADSDEEPLSLDTAIVPRSWDEVAASGEMGEIIAELSRGLPPEKRDILNLYLYEDLPLKEIGDFMGLSESRISQIFTEILQFLTERAAQGKFAGRGSVLRELVDEYGEVRGIGGAGEGAALPARVVAILQLANQQAPVQFQLSQEGEGFVAEERAGGFEKLVEKIAQRQEGERAKRTPLPADQDSGFTFFDGPQQE